MLQAIKKWVIAQHQNEKKTIILFSNQNEEKIKSITAFSNIGNTVKNSFTYKLVSTSNNCVSSSACSISSSSANRSSYRKWELMLFCFFFCKCYGVPLSVEWNQANHWSSLNVTTFKIINASILVNLIACRKNTLIIQQ